MSYASIIRFLAERPGCRVALTAHLRPDGDALGSCLGLASVLRSRGYHASVVNPDPIPPHLSFIANPELIAANTGTEWWNGFDCLGILDCGEPGRLEEVNRNALGKLPTFTIDHHITSAGIGQAIWIEPEASSTGEMVVKLCRAAGWPLPSDAAMALWTAIVSDTGRFSYENTSPDALAAGRECVLAGADPALAARAIYQSVSMPERKLQTRVLERLELHEEGRLGLSWIMGRDFSEAGTNVEGAPDLINLVRDTAGVEVAIFLYEPPPDPSGKQTVKISLRTQNPHDALLLVGQYGGGGHKRAAGASVSLPLEDARKQILAAAKQAFFP